MGLEIARPLGVGGINPNIYINRNSFNTGFGQQLDADRFERQSVERYTSEAAIKRMINANPKIKKIVKNFNPEMKLNLAELKELLNNHSSDTQKIAIGIAENLPFSLRNKVNLKAIDDAAYLHDIGKVLIPENILNKAGKLDDNEIKIMHTHSELSYELLKHSDIDTRTLDLIKYHHQNPLKSGYPQAKPDFNADINLQVLSAADKFSALTEKRPYKEPLSNEQALGIMYKDVKEGKMHPFIFKALVAHVHAQAPADKTAKSA